MLTPNVHRRRCLDGGEAIVPQEALQQAGPRGRRKLWVSPPLGCRISPPWTLPHSRGFRQGLSNTLTGNFHHAPASSCGHPTNTCFPYGATQPEHHPLATLPVRRTGRGQRHPIVGAAHAAPEGQTPGRCVTKCHHERSAVAVAARAAWRAGHRPAGPPAHGGRTTPLAAEQGAAATPRAERGVDRRGPKWPVP